MCECSVDGKNRSVAAAAEEAARPAPLRVVRPIDSRPVERNRSTQTLFAARSVDTAAGGFLSAVAGGGRLVSAASTTSRAAADPDGNDGRSVSAPRLSVGNFVRASKISKDELVTSLSLINECRNVRTKSDFFDVIAELGKLVKSFAITSRRCDQAQTPGLGVNADDSESISDGWGECASLSPRDALIVSETELCAFDVVKGKFSACYMRRPSDHFICLSGDTAESEFKFEYQILMAYLMPHLHDAYHRLEWNSSMPMAVGEKSPLKLFTPREIEVLRWLITGKSNWEMSRIVSISERTIKYHLKQIYHKLGVSTRTQAISMVHSMGLAEQTLRNYLDAK